MKPRARQDALIIEDLDDEVLVYDSTRNRAHRLNRVASLVWRMCDGETSVDDMVVRLQMQLGPDIDGQLVWLALKRLGRAHLLQEPLKRPFGLDAASRRQAMRRLALVGGLPIVASIVAPTPAEAASCIVNIQCLSW
jgi:hypothetical protein